MDLQLAVRSILYHQYTFTEVCLVALIAALVGACIAAWQFVSAVKPSPHVQTRH